MTQHPKRPKNPQSSLRLRFLIGRRARPRLAPPEYYNSSRQPAPRACSRRALRRARSPSGHVPQPRLPARRQRCRAGPSSGSLGLVLLLLGLLLRGAARRRQARHARELSSPHPHRYPYCAHPHRGQCTPASSTPENRAGARPSVGLAPNGVFDAHPLLAHITKPGSTIRANHTGTLRRL
jgi:hypothetical protein